MKTKSIFFSALFLVCLSTSAEAKSFSGSSTSVSSNGCVTTTTWSWWGLVEETSTDCSGAGTPGGLASEKPF